MEIIERNYSHSLQAYVNHCNDEEAKDALRKNLIARLFNFVSNDLQQDEIHERIIPKARIRVVKIIPTEGFNRPLFMGGLTVPPLDFGGTEEPITEILRHKFQRVGVEMPTDRMLDDRMERLYSDHTFDPDPFQLTSADLISVDVEEITDTDYSDYLYNELHGDDAHFETVKAVAIVALDKHLKTNPNIPRNRVDSGIANLTRELESPQQKEELRRVLTMFVDEKDKRPFLLKEAQDYLDLRNKKAQKGIPLWVIISIVSVLLLGVAVYMNRKKISNAREFSKDATKEVGGSRIGNFTKALFTREGREVAHDYLNNKKINQQSSDYLKRHELIHKENENNFKRSSLEMSELFKKWKNGK